MTHGSLFSGGGGFDLAAEVLGWKNSFHCEIDPFCNQILNYYWPKAHSYGDVRQFNAKPFKGKIDVLTGGFPCQPFSVAGKRKGTSDSRHLWPEMRRVIREVEPKWVVGENVYGLLNWNGGLVFEQVQADLEALGYEVQTFVLPACGVNAPHRRYRVWFIARAKSGNASHTYGKRLEGRTKAGNLAKGWQREIKQYARLCKSGYWHGWPTQSPVCGRNDGLPRELDGITVSKWKNESIKLYGNAIVPQIALRLFRAIAHMSKHE